jgi:hypothetical protein
VSNGRRVSKIIYEKAWQLSAVIILTQSSIVLVGLKKTTIYFVRDRGPQDRELSFGATEYHFTSMSVEILVNCGVNVNLVGFGKKVLGLYEMQCCV